jgi:hypothetical protein
VKFPERLSVDTFSPHDSLATVIRKSLIVLTLLSQVASQGALVLCVCRDGRKSIIFSWVACECCRWNQSSERPTPKAAACHGKTCKCCRTNEPDRQETGHRFGRTCDACTHYAVVSQQVVPATSAPQQVAADRLLALPDLAFFAGLPAALPQARHHCFCGPPLQSVAAHLASTVLRC